MDIVFTKISDKTHGVYIQRSDGSTDYCRLNSRSFLRHDFAHFAVEQELGLNEGFWGSVACGAPLAGTGIRGTQILLAESIAGPVQTLMRTGANAEKFYSVLENIRPGLVSRISAENIRATGNKLEGHWRATPYGGDMNLQWLENMQQ